MQICTYVRGRQVSILFCKKYLYHKNFNIYFVFLFTKIKNYVRKLQHMFKQSSFNFNKLKIAFGIDLPFFSKAQGPYWWQRIHDGSCPAPIFLLMLASFYLTFQFLKAVECINSTGNKDELLSVQNLKNHATNEPVKENRSHRNSVQEAGTDANQTSSPTSDIPIQEQVITDDRFIGFIAPALRNSRTSSAQSEKNS